MIRRHAPALVLLAAALAAGPAAAQPYNTYVSGLVREVAERCFLPPDGAAEAGAYAELSVVLGDFGLPVEIVPVATHPQGPAGGRMAQAAIQAVARCAPYGALMGPVLLRFEAPQTD